ncbi:hypothetical protein ABFA25_05775 [Mycobacterium lepromatosis]|nr:hypothetical protein [Mycobacterium lepromatosis]
MIMPSQWIKTGCTEAYSRDGSALLLSDSNHPGGTALTRRLVNHLGLRALGLTCIVSGIGATTWLLTREYDVTVDGVDLVKVNVNNAQATTVEARQDVRLCFHHGYCQRISVARQHSRRTSARMRAVHLTQHKTSSHGSAPGSVVPTTQ